MTIEPRSRSGIPGSHDVQIPSSNGKCRPGEYPLCAITNPECTKNCRKHPLALPAIPILPQTLPTGRDQMDALFESRVDLGVLLRTSRWVSPCVAADIPCGAADWRAVCRRSPKARFQAKERVAHGILVGLRSHCTRERRGNRRAFWGQTAWGKSVGGDGKTRQSESVRRQNVWAASSE